MEFGERIRVFANRKFGSLTNLAEALGMNLPDLHRYVTEKVQPKRDFFAKMLRLGCDINWLLSGSDDVGFILREMQSDYKTKSLEDSISKELEEISERVNKLQSIIKNEGYYEKG